MSPALVVIGVLVFLALGASAIAFANERTAPALFQSIGTAFLSAVVFAHVAEAFHLFPSMGWGVPESAGHYIDPIGAIGGLILFPTGYLWRRLAKRRT